MEVPISCNRDCGAGCALMATVVDGRITDIRDSPHRPPGAEGCLRGYRYAETVYAGDRLKTPLVRTGKRGSREFSEVSWDSALDLVAEKLSEIRDNYGPEALMVFSGSGSCRGAVHNTGRLPKRLFELWGGYTGLWGSYSSGAMSFVLPYLFGTPQTGFDASNLRSSKLIVLWGADIMVTRFGSQLATAVAEARSAGTPVVVVDPRKTRTVKALASEWLSPFPGTDTAMLAAMLQILIENDLVDRDFVDSHSTGFGELDDYLSGKADGQPKTAEWAEPVCGVPAESIRAFALQFARTPPVALIPGLSIQRTLGGEETYRFTTALQVATGNVGRIGGSSGGAAWGALPRPKCPTVASGGSEGSVKRVPAYQWPDAVLGGRDGGYPSNIRGIYNVASNFLNQGSDIRKNIRAFEAVDFVVTHDLFMTPTAAYSDVILPSTSFVEREDVVFPAENYLYFSNQAIPPLYECRDDYDILRDLSARLGLEDRFSEGRSASEWLDQLIADSAVVDADEFKRTGVFDGGDHDRLAFVDFARDPGANPLPTPSGRIEIASERYASETGGSRIPICRIATPSEEFPLRLVSPHARSRVNSSNANLPWTHSHNEDLLYMNPADAANRKIADGDTVTVESDVGSLTLQVAVTEEIRTGVLCLYQGAWFTGAPGQQPWVNLLTSTEPTLPSHSSRTHSVFVKVRR